MITLVEKNWFYEEFCGQQVAKCLSLAKGVPAYPLPEGTLPATLPPCTENSTIMNDMNDQPKIQSIQEVLGFLAPEDVAELNDVAQQRIYSPDTIVCHEGEIEHTFYIIEHGLLSVTRKLNDNTEQVLGILRDGQFFGEMALLDEEPRSATVSTLSECRLIEISEESFDLIINRNPTVAVTLLRGISRSLRDTNRIAIAEMSLKNQELARALEELKAVQAELLRQERLRRDLEIASDVQRSILPAKFPNIPGLQFSVKSRPAREVGGDFYDVIAINDRQVGIVTADVSGKSVQAAIFMAIVRALLLRESVEGHSPAETMHRLHRQLMKTSTADMFVTIFYAIIDIETKYMHYVRAGHERPILYKSKTKSLQLLNPPGRFVGLWPNLVVEEAELVLRPGDCLVCYSDGVTDAENPYSEKFGLDRLFDLVSEQGHGSAEDLTQQILDSVEQFTDTADQTDDITIFVTKMT